MKSNCSIQSYVPALAPLLKYGVEKVLVCTYQAISGAGKTFERWPEMVDNCIPYIGGEEEKSEQEPLKVFGRVADGKIVPAEDLSITAQCFRVACQDGHMAAVFLKFKEGCTPSVEQIKADWAAYAGRAQELALPRHPNSSCTILKSRTAPKPAWIVIWRAAWPFLWVVCALIRSMTTNSSDSATTLCAVRPAAAYFWRNCCAQKDISQKTNTQNKTEASTRSSSPSLFLHL